MKTPYLIFVSYLMLGFVCVQTFYPAAIAYGQEPDTTKEVSDVSAGSETSPDDGNSAEDRAQLETPEDEDVTDEVEDAPAEDADQPDQESIQEGESEEEVDEDEMLKSDEEETTSPDVLLQNETGADSATLQAEEDTSASTAVGDSATTTENQDVELLATSTLSFTVENQEATTTLKNADDSMLRTSSTTASTTDEETTTIVSGQSIALANILNMVNSNFVNSEGVVLFSNFFETVMGAIDFRQYFDPLANYACSLVSCQGENVAVNIDNNASIENEVLVSASSGNNEIHNAENGVIETGDAYAGLNLVNVANTNLIDSNYLLVTLNAFQGVDGDIVFPSLSQFFSSLAHGASTPQVIDIENSASVTNNVSIDANAGNNTTEYASSSTIQTGNAIGSSNVFNQLNSSLVGGQSVAIVFRVHGSWAGEIFGAPDDLGWTVGDDGSIYLFDVGGQSTNGQLSMHGTSTARIDNNVSVVALTGENAITNAETAVISTGNAYAGANVINVANANVIGRNWILAVINIFGDFNGNIAFGRPDLWVGGQMDVPNSISNGSELTYTFTVINNGDSTASDVVLQTDVQGEYLKIIDSSLASAEQKGAVRFELGDIPAGSAVEVVYTAQVDDAPAGTEIVTTARVQAHETDNNADDNTEVLSVSTDERRGDGIRIELNQSSKDVPAEEVAEEVVLTTKRLTPNTTMNISSVSAEQKLVVSNKTQEIAHNVVLHDLLRDPSGTVIQDEVWELGNVLPGEEIELGYVIAFNPNAPYGTYTLHTHIEGSNITAVAADNGSIVYAEVPDIVTPLMALLSEDSSPDKLAAAADTSDEVYYGKETPLLSAFGTAVVHAGEEKHLASAIASGVPIDPAATFLIGAFLFLAVSLIRFFRFV